MRPIALWAGVAALLVICERWLTSCVGVGPCMSSLVGPNDWFSLTLAATTFLGVLTGGALAARAAWLMVASDLELRHLPASPPPDRLPLVAASMGVRRLRFLPSSVPAVFCAGALRPTVYISQGTLQRLGPQELAAVLLHELEHASSFDPVRRATWRAASEVFFFLPLVFWVRSRRIESSELRADRRAIDSVGAKPVASALWSMGSSAPIATVTAFSGTIEVRAAQLLGDPLPRRLPSATMIAASVGGFAVALTVIACLAQVASQL